MRADFECAVSARTGLLVTIAFALLWAGRLSAQTEAGPNLPVQPIGPSDLLSVSVYGSPELTRTVRVSAEGEIRLPLLRETIAASGLFPNELESRVAAALEQEQIVVDPAVTITIAEYHSRPIAMAGALKSPLTFQASGKTTLLEALTRAQGLAEDAGPEILVTRPARAGGAPVVERIPVRGLIDGADPDLNLVLEGGEEVRVPQVGRVFVVGNVKHPGGFRVEEGGGMTVLKALAMAEGLSPYSTKNAYIFRRTNSPSKEIPVELRKIMDRKTEDVMLQANDILYIPDSRAKRTAMSALERAVGFATATASGALVLGVNR